MKRIIMMVLRNILLVPWMWAKLCYHASHVDKYTEEEHYRMLQFITHRANKGGNVTIDAHGLENIPKENGFMFFPNHQGLYDVPVSYTHLDVYKRQVYTNLLYHILGITDSCCVYDI